ncbi:hypothetical protein DL93DRAFT_154937 [Clavulina sp. PMI_390]|nr:hypothetical protein DL93DRAFT_154937 [Clavulina sp. PMI_390]
MMLFPVSTSLLLLGVLSASSASAVWTAALASLSGFIVADLLNALVLTSNNTGVSLAGACQAVVASDSASGVEDGRLERVANSEMIFAWPSVVLRPGKSCALRLSWLLVEATVFAMLSACPAPGAW